MPPAPSPWRPLGGALRRVPGGPRGSPVRPPPLMGEMRCGSPGMDGQPQPGPHPAAAPVQWRPQCDLRCGGGGGLCTPPGTAGERTCLAPFPAPVPWRPPCGPRSGGGGLWSHPGWMGSPHGTPDPVHSAPRAPCSGEGASVRPLCLLGRGPSPGFPRCGWGTHQPDPHSHPASMETPVGSLPPVVGGGLTDGDPQPDPHPWWGWHREG